MGTNILPENLKGRNILCTLGLPCQWGTYTLFMLVLEKWLCPTKPLFYCGEGGTTIVLLWVVHTCNDTTSQEGRGRDKQLLASYELPPTPPLIMSEFILETNYPSRRIIRLRRISVQYKFGANTNYGAKFVSG